MRGFGLIYRAELPTGAPPERVEFDNAQILEKLREVVGGDIELVPYWNRMQDGTPCAAFCNEHGKMLKLPLNQRATLIWYGYVGQVDDLLVGNVIVVSGDEEFMEEL